MLKNKNTHYIDNEKFLEAILDHKKQCLLAKQKNRAEPRMPDYIGECFIKIAKNLSRKPNFSNYPSQVLEDMLSDAVLNCVEYYRNFDPEKSKNTFAYFTQIIFYAFIRRISREKKRLYHKYKAIEQSGILNEHELFEDTDGNIQQFEMYDNISEFINNYETSVKKKKIAKLKEKALDKFFGE